MTRGRSAGTEPGAGPDRAVIDIGSNTVRLVIYAGPARAPRVWFNERVSAKLGRDLALTGKMADKAMDSALRALARYATIIEDFAIADVQTVATAAVRDSSNGEEFLAQVRALGLAPRLLAGDEEARASAFGVIGAFPGARGTVADLGGGSLELVTIGDGDCHDGVSLPLGTLRLPALRARGARSFDKEVRAAIGRVGWAATDPSPMYMVGGTWRALAVLAMRNGKYPLSDPHGFVLTRAEAEELAGQVERMDSVRLAALPGISATRAGALPDAAALLRLMLGELQPDSLVFSSWGLREGLLFQRLDPELRRQDPLIAAVAHFTETRGGAPALAAIIGAWTADAVPGNDAAAERLRFAATLLALAMGHIEPNLRARQAHDWAMEKRWVGLDAAGRARIAAMLLAAGGRQPIDRPELVRLAGAEALREAVAWGMAFRLCKRLGSGSRVSLITSRLIRSDRVLCLWLHPSRAQLLSEQVKGDLKQLAEWIGLKPVVAVSETPEAALDA